MDVKGASWVSNFYEKFEAMCLEVEEVMYQDTVKYVENQAQTVCSSMKKFYSDVMQDLLPPPSINAATGGDFNGDVGIYMKPNIDKKTAKFEDLEKVAEDQIKATNCNSSLCDKSSLRTRKSSKRDNSTLNERLGSNTRLDEDINIDSPRDSFHQEGKIFTSKFDEETGTDFALESQNENIIVSEQIAEISTDYEYEMNKEMDMRASLNDDGAMSLVESCSNWQPQSYEMATHGVDFLYSSEVNEANASFLSETERVDKANLEESCILVNRDDFRIVPCHERKSKSYQKKIRDVFSPRKRSTRFLEYEQLAMWPHVDDSSLKKEANAGNSIPSLAIKDEKRLPTADEAEWELL